MKNSKNLKDLELEMMNFSDAWVTSLRANLFRIMDGRSITIRQLADAAGINYDTLKSFLYGDPKDCKVGPLINICRAFGVSLDGLCGAGTVSADERALVLNFRQLPPAVAYYYKWSLDTILKSNGVNMTETDVPLLQAMVWTDGSLHLSPEVGVYNVTHLSANLSAKIKAALRVPCDYYMPLYSPYHVLFIANDRASLKGEHSVVIINEELIITEIKDGGCYSLRDGGFRCPLSSVDQVLGYIAATCILDEPVL